MFAHGAMDFFYLVIFPGFLFTVVVGLISTWVDRKVTARLQWRVGPPWYQPFADMAKLLGKESIIPQGASRVWFFATPFLGFAAVMLVSTMVWMANIFPEASFVGDLIVAIYLLYLPSIALIVAGSASRNPFGALGASREMKLMLAYEVAFLFAIFTVVVKNGGIISLGGIVDYQLSSGAMLGQGASCIIAFIVVLLCVPAKLVVAPFDIAEAETELIAGPYIEYSGLALAIFKLTRAMLLFTLPIFILTLFARTVWTPWTILWYVLILVFVIVVKNTNPRLRIDQAMKFFWGAVLVLSIIGIILAAVGL
ncbi:MAG: complex I subunit 1 family protein [Chloroflexota bacterium]|nr:complex I subunit 1 family protein [Chloroflexota bacterium]